MEDFAGPGPCRQQRVIAELFRVPVSGALFVVSVDLGDRGVDIDHQRLGRCGAGTESPNSLQHTIRNSVELADMTERERPKERPDRRGCHDPERQHPLCRPRPQHVYMIDVGCASDHRAHQRQNFPAR